MSNWRNSFLYLVFGVLTTVINIFSYILLTAFLGINYLIATLISWFISVLFAFITNKIFVFQSKGFQYILLIKGIIIPFITYIFSCFEAVLMILLIEKLEINDLISKIFTNIFVIIMNYIFSKKVIFKVAKEN